MLVAGSLLNFALLNQQIFVFLQGEKSINKYLENDLWLLYVRVEWKYLE